MTPGYLTYFRYPCHEEYDGFRAPLEEKMAVVRGKISYIYKGRAV